MSGCDCDRFSICDYCRTDMASQPRSDERSGVDSGTPTPAPTRPADGAVDAPAHHLGGKMECIDAIDALVSQLRMSLPASMPGRLSSTSGVTSERGERSRI